MPDLPVLRRRRRRHRSASLQPLFSLLLRAVVVRVGLGGEPPLLLRVFFAEKEKGLGPLIFPFLFFFFFWV